MVGHYVFEDSDTGEEFIVCSYSKEQAMREARVWFADPQFIYEFTEEEAEASGLDEF